MKKISIFTAIILVATLGLFSCQNDEVQTEEQAIDQEQYPEITKKLQEMYFNTDGLEKVDFQLPDGSFQEMFKVEGDMMFTRKQIENMKMGGDITTKQYRTNNLVSDGVITIIGYTGGGGFGLSNKERTALQWAVNNYNRLNLDIRFSLTFGTDFQSRDMVVYNNPNQSGSGGSAGFPTNGNPFKFVQIFGLSGFSTNVNEHIITHEIGHSVGFRHTDWFSRQSCGQNVNEGSAGVGAVHIPGTPTGYDSTSLMLACFANNEDGEFNANDITALRFMY
ncbi:MAG: zinc-dependent metalloprotease [Flavobacteriaceae bacterium]|nr:zinc-dependent metalloprotease [Flavobacteriaceae bacterium]